MTMPSKKAICSASSSPVASGSFSDLAGTNCANGYLKIIMVAPDGSVASLAGGGEINATEPIRITLDAAGVPSAGQTMFMSDQFSSPVNPAFNIEIHNSNDRTVGTIKNALISGVAPVDLTALVPTGNGSSFVNALILGTGTTSSSQLATALTDETGTGAAVFGTGAVISPTSVTTGQVIQPAATALTIKDNQGGTRYSIPSGGSAQATLNNTLITGGSSYGGVTPSFQKFVTNGTFTIPANVTAVKVTVVGGGGAGGGASVTNTGSGGGSGGFAQKWLSGLTPGNTLAVTVGAGGTGVSNASGNNGSASTVASGTQTIATITANGGVGGQASTDPGPGGGAAISTGGDINGGGAAASFVSTASNFGGAGGATFLGGSGNFIGASGAGLAALANTGSGGGGAGIGATNAGGAGAAGIVIFEWVQ